MAVVAACSSTTTVNNPTGDDASTTDGSTTTPEPDSAAATDTGTVTPTDSSTAVADASADAALVCDIPDGSDACDSCVLTNCCAEETTCQDEPANDAGSTDCVDIFSCVQDCIAPPADSGVDAGSLTDCSTACVAGHTTTGMTDFATLSACLVNSCSTMCN